MKKIYSKSSVYNHIIYFLKISIDNSYIKLWLRIKEKKKYWTKKQKYNSIICNTKKN